VKLMAKIALKILEYLQASDKVFEEMCANDVDIDDPILFGEQLDVLYRKEYIEIPPRSLSEIDLSAINFIDKIKSIETKVNVGITVDGALIIPKLRSISNRQKE